jgi:hypothetical protein
MKLHSVALGILFRRGFRNARTNQQRRSQNFLWASIPKRTNEPTASIAKHTNGPRAIPDPYWLAMMPLRAKRAPRAILIYDNPSEHSSTYNDLRLPSEHSSTFNDLRLPVFIPYRTMLLHTQTHCGTLPPMIGTTSTGKLTTIHTHLQCLVLHHAHMAPG